MHGSADAWLFVRLATVWNRHLGLFLFSSIKAEKYDDLAAEMGMLIASETFLPCQEENL